MENGSAYRMGTEELSTFDRKIEFLEHQDNTKPLAEITVSISHSVTILERLENMHREFAISLRYDSVVL